MAEPEETPISTTEAYDAILRERCPPTTEGDLVRGSIVMSLARRVDAVEADLAATRAQCVELVKAAAVLAGHVGRLVAAAGAAGGGGGAAPGPHVAPPEQAETPPPPDTSEDHNTELN